MNFKKLLFAFAIFSFFSQTSLGLAYVASSPNYRLEKDSLNFSGAEVSTSTNYGSSDTLGEIISGFLNGLNYYARAGYRYAEFSPGIVSFVLGCTDSQANNYNPLANQDDGSCTYGSVGGGGDNISGCTDESALNYNPRANVDNGQCLFGVPNITNFSARYDSVRKIIALTWRNPDVEFFDSVLITRGKGFIPTGFNLGSIIYDGQSENFNDQDLEIGFRYYYVAFVRTITGHYSSGVIATEFAPEDEPLAVYGCTDQMAPNYNPRATIDDGSCSPLEIKPDISGCLDPRALNYNSQATLDDNSCYYDPFLLTSADTGNQDQIAPVSELKTDWDLFFVQAGEKTKTLDWRMRVKIDGTKNLTILLSARQPLSGLKTIGLTLTDSVDKTKTASFLMRSQSANNVYEATIGPLLNGTYQLDIHIIDYQTQITKRFRGYLVITDKTDGFLLPKVVEERVMPVVATTGLVVSFFPSFYDLLTVLFRAIGYLFGRRRNEKPWGTVYDSVTKRPLDPVYLSVNQNGQEITTAITDIDGRFSFFLPAGDYTIKANKTHYRFPSEKLKGKNSDELYDHLYFGENLTTGGETVINVNIPMDPIEFDWNEFAKTKRNFFEFYDYRQLWFSRFYRTVFIIGLGLSLYLFLFVPVWWNIIILALYLGFLVIDRLWRRQHSPLRVIRETTKEPLSFAIIRVFLPDLNQQIKHTVADQFGYFHLLVRPGVYYYTVEEKQTDGSYLKVFQSKPINLPKGVLTENISVK